MFLFNNGIVVLAVGLISSGYAFAQEPDIPLQDYTSKISVTTIDGFYISQEIGSPISIPKSVEGDVTIFQGLWASLTGISAGITSIVPDIQAENSLINIDYNAESGILSVKFPGETPHGKIAISDTSGKIILSEVCHGPAFRRSLANLPAGIYMAMAVIENNSYKSLKFYVK